MSMEWAGWSQQGQIADDAAKKPPSSQARVYLEQASVMSKSVINDIKKHLRILSDRDLPQRRRTWASTQERALELDKDVHVNFVLDIGEWLATDGIKKKSDAEVKILLNDLKPTYEELEACLACLKSAVASTKPNKAS